MSSIKHTGINLLVILVLMVSMLAVLVPATPAQAVVTSITINSPTSISRALVKPGGTVTVNHTLNGTTGDDSNINFQVWSASLGTVFNQVILLSENETASTTINVSLTSAEGLYNLTLSRSDNTSIAAVQTGAIYVDNTAPSINVVTPNSSTCWKGGVPQTLQWSASDTASTDNLTIYADLSINGGSTYPTSIIAGVSYSQGAQNFTFTPVADISTCKIRMKAIDRAGNESAYVYSPLFPIITTGPSASVASPGGTAGESYNGGASTSITGTLSGSGTTLNYMIELLTGGVNTDNITPTWASATLSGGVYPLSYTWTLPTNKRGSNFTVGLLARDCAGNYSSLGTSANNFRIVDVIAPTVTLTAPTTGATWYAGSSQTISWTQIDNVSGNLCTVTVYYTYDGGANWYLIGSGLLPQGSQTYSWTVPNTPSTNCKIKVVANDCEIPANSGTGYSGTFTIASGSTVPSVTTCTPNGGESYQGGTVQNITWTAADSPDATARMTYTIKYSTDGGASYPNTIATLTNQAQCSSCTCSYSWAVPNITTTQAKIQITATDPAGNSAVSVSSSVFSITASACGVDTVNITLNTGWNLISLQENPINTNIDSILSSVIPSVTSVWLYDSVCPSTSATWYSYAPGAPSTLLTMESGKAYWVNMAAGGPFTLTFQGRKCPCPPASPTTFTVCRTGWNMIGFKSTIAKPVQSYLASLGTCGTAYLAPINGYASGAWTTVNCTDNMTAGSGYWIYINSTGTINPGCD
jgi:hypothetical protein